MQEQQDIEQKISQFLDGELDQQQALSLLKTMRNNPHVESTMMRYQLIGQIIRTEKPVYHPCSLQEKVSHSLQREVIHFRPEQKRFSGKRLVAVAAALTAIAISIPSYLTLQKNHQNSANAALNMAAAKPVVTPTNSLSTPVTIAKNETEAQPADLPSDAHQRFKDYLYEHSNRKFIATNEAYTPYVRTVGLNQE